MAEKSIFEQIKKQNGEGFAKAIRAYDSGIFDVPDIVNIVRYAGREAEPIIPYLESLKKVPIEKNTPYKDPIELLAEAGYRAWYADTMDKQNAISKYFAPGEELCTFNDPERFRRFHIINAVRHDADKLKRTDFYGREEREDTYGTSVLSIQILKAGGFISIKNRYNHKVSNPDNTFHSNPDNIIHGLSYALKERFAVDFSSHLIMPPPEYLLVGHRLVRYQSEEYGIYVSDGCYVKNGHIYPIDRDKEILFEYFILNLKNKTIQNLFPTAESFVPVLQDEIRDKPLQVLKNKIGERIVTVGGDPLLTLKGARLIELNLPTTKSIGSQFLSFNKELRHFSAPMLEHIGSSFLECNEKMESFRAPQLKSVENYFMMHNNSLKELILPALEDVGASFMRFNRVLTKLDLPALAHIGDKFCSENDSLKTLILPAVRQIRYNFLYNNNSLEILQVPVLSHAFSGFLGENSSLRKLLAPQLTDKGLYCLCWNKLFKTDAPAWKSELSPDRILPTPSPKPARIGHRDIKVPSDRFENIRV